MPHAGCCSSCEKRWRFWFRAALNINNILSHLRILKRLSIRPWVMASLITSRLCIEGLSIRARLIITSFWPWKIETMLNQPPMHMQNLGLSVSNNKVDKTLIWALQSRTTISHQPPHYRYLNCFEYLVWRRNLNFLCSNTGVWFISSPLFSITAPPVLFRISIKNDGSALPACSQVGRKTKLKTRQLAAIEDRSVQTVISGLWWIVGALNNLWSAH